jgi:DNA-binding PadR family transcriptional regulator
LARLEARGMIECQSPPNPTRSRQRPYALTESGLLSLQRWLGSLHAFAVGGLDRLAGVGGPATIDLREPGQVDQPV